MTEVEPMINGLDPHLALHRQPSQLLEACSFSNGQVI